MLPNESHELYMGIPTFVGRSKNRVLDGIKHRISKKLQNWRISLFSMGGREILIKAVAHATSSYTMSVFKLPFGLCHSIQMMITKFWWSNNKDVCIFWKKMAASMSSKVRR